MMPNFLPAGALPALQHILYMMQEDEDGIHHVRKASKGL